MIVHRHCNANVRYRSGHPVSERRRGLTEHTAWLSDVVIPTFERQYDQVPTTLGSFTEFA